MSHYMMTSSNGNIFRVTGPLCGEFTGPGEFPTQRPVTRIFDVFLDLRLNKRLSKAPLGWWFKTSSWSLWRHRNDDTCQCTAHNLLYTDIAYMWSYVNWCNNDQSSFIIEALDVYKMKQLFAQCQISERYDHYNISLISRLHEILR